MSLWILFLLAIGLSMDAFSLALIYGTLNMKETYHRWMSLFVGIFHFFMPILGYTLGKWLFQIIPMNPQTIAGVIFVILSIEMLASIKKEETIKILENIYSICLFAFTVSIDSFSIGIGLGSLTTHISLAAIIFAITSATFTYLGVKLGNLFAKKYGKISTLIGSIILFCLGLYYIF